MYEFLNSFKTKKKCKISPTLKDQFKDLPDCL